MDKLKSLFAKIRKFRVPRRYQMAIMCAFTYSIASSSSRTLSSIVIFVLEVTNKSFPGYEPNCPYTESSETTEPSTDWRNVAEYGWGNKHRWQQIEMFYIFYSLVGAPLGGLADVFGAKPVLNTIMIVCSIATVLLPFVMHASNGNRVLIRFYRAVYGFCMGGQFSVAASLMAHWAPSTERTTLCAITFVTVYLDAITGDIIPIYLMRQTGDYGIPCYVLGILGGITAAIWYFFGASNPQVDKYITKREKDYLETQLTNVSHERKSIPFLKILLSWRVWAFMAGACGHSWFYYFRRSVLRLIFRKLLSMTGAGAVLTAMRYIPSILISVFMVLLGFFVDRLLNRGVTTRTSLRKTCSNLGILGPPTYIMSTMHVLCYPKLRMWMTVVARVLEIFAWVGIRVVGLDLAPNYAGFLSGLGFGLGTIFTVLSFQLILRYLDNINMDQITYTLFVYEGCAFVGALIFTIFGKASEQKWNNPKKGEEEPTLTSNRVNENSSF